MTGDAAFLDPVVDRIASWPGVVAVALGGSRAVGDALEGSDWDLALYYRGSFDTDLVRAAGWDGEVTDIGAWGGGVMNGGAWLTIDGRRVDLMYRDLDEVEHWVAEAEAGRFQKQLLLFYLAGIPTYVVMAELAVNRVLHGSLPRPAYPDALRREATRRWHDDAVLSVDYARRVLASRGDRTIAAGNLARALVEEAQSRLASRGEWVLNEKGIVERAGLDHLAPDGDDLAGAIDGAIEAFGA